MLGSQNDKRSRSQRHSVLWLFCLLFGFAGICPLFAAKPNFTASLDRESVIVGETVLLTLADEKLSPDDLTIRAVTAQPDRENFYGSSKH